MKDKLNKLFENKKVLILGMGREGKSTYKFIKKFYPDLKLSTADKKQGDDYLKNLKDFDLIIKSPGISWNIKEIKEAKENGIKFTSQTQIFLDLFRDQTIGVTGTKGKSTTSSLIYHILKNSGKNSKLVGNIGKPVLDYIGKNDRDTIFVYEVSSHQLSDITKSPHIAVFLNIYPEHLDYYSDFKEYFEAKANITKFQNNDDILIYCSDFEELRKLVEFSKTQQFSFSSKDSLDKFGIRISKIPLLGRHNLNNIKAAILASQHMVVSNQNIKKGIETFIPLEDRLETIGSVNGVSFVNDTLATIPQATIAALNAFGDKEITIILGGFDREIDFDILGSHISKRQNIQNVILIGQTAKRIKKSLLKYNYSGKIHDLGNSGMEEVVKLAYKITPKGGVVLLSPASASFDMFKDYKDRGNQFKKAVRRLKEGIFA